MEKEKIISLFKAKGVDVGKLLFWLQQPKQGIMPQLAILVIKEVAQELDEGKEWYKDSLFYPEEWRKQMAKGSFPESFWLENYVLERCRWAQEDLLLATELKNKESDFSGFSATLEEIKNKVYGVPVIEEKLRTEIQANTEATQCHASELQPDLEAIREQINTIKVFLKDMNDRIIMSTATLTMSIKNEVTEQFLFMQKELNEIADSIKKEITEMSMGLGIGLGGQKKTLEQIEAELTKRFDTLTSLVDSYKKNNELINSRLSSIEKDNEFNIQAAGHINTKLDELLQRRTFFGLLGDVFRRIFGHGRRA